MQITSGRWHFYIASVQTDEAMSIEPILKNKAKNVEAPVIHKA